MNRASWALACAVAGTVAAWVMPGAGPPPAWGNAVEPPAFTMPDSPPGRCAAAYFAMMSAASRDAAAAFETAWACTARAERSTLDERTGRAAELRAQWGSLTPLRVVGSGPSSVTLAVRSQNQGDMLFEFQLSADGRLDAIVISSGDGVAEAMPVTAEARAEVVAGAARALRAGYVFPETGERMASAIEEKLASGAYDAVATEPELARRLTEDLRAISNDKHLAVGAAPRSAPARRGMPSLSDMRRENYAFRKVEILPGNIGYLKFDLFVQEDEAKAVAAGAMAFLANCDAVVFDLRSNGGGSPEMIRFLTSYLFDQPTHLNDMVDRSGAVVEEYWTVSDVPGRRFPADLPVYVLTSGRTFSGAEEFSYNLKNLRRATIVGETTGGGAHPVRGEPINDRFMIRVPYMRAQNPITGTNWEGTGVEPDVKTPAADALEKAQTLAREEIARRRSQGAR